MSVLCWCDGGWSEYLKHYFVKKWEYCSKHPPSMKSPKTALHPSIIKCSLTSPYSSGTMVTRWFDNPSAPSRLNLLFT